MKEKPVYSDGYERIGDCSDYMDVSINNEHAEMLRQTVVRELFVPFGVKVPRIQAHSNEHNEAFLNYSAFYGVKSKFISAYDFTEPSIFVGAHIRQFHDDRWHLTITENHSGLVEEVIEQRERNILKVICWGKEVMEAKREYKVARAVPAVIASAFPLTDASFDQEATHKRVGYTTPLMPEDCETMAQTITRHSARVQIDRGMK